MTCFQSRSIVSMVLRCRTYLGWTFRGSSYCQLIRHENKQKRLGRGYIANSLERCPESHGLCPSRLPVAKMTTVFSDSNSSPTVFLNCSVTVPLPVCSLSWPFLCRFQTALLPYSYRFKTVQLRFLSVRLRRTATIRCAIASFY